MTGTITKQGICIIAKNDIEKTCEVVAYFPVPTKQLEFITFKDDGVQHKTVMMDVEKAGLVGNAVGGLGAGLYSAAKAAEINANGGKHITSKIKIDRLGLKAGDFRMEIDEVFFFKNGAFRPSGFKPSGANAKDIANRLNGMVQKS